MNTKDKKGMDILTDTVDPPLSYSVSDTMDVRLDIFRQPPAENPLPIEYSQCISPEEIQSDNANRGFESIGLATLHRQIDPAGQTSRDGVTGRPQVARLSMAERRGAPTGRPRVDIDRRRTERLLAGSNFNQAQSDNHV